VVGGPIYLRVVVKLSPFRQYVLLNFIMASAAAVESRRFSRRCCGGRELVAGLVEEP
jgi:hypothetical protein